MKLGKIIYKPVLDSQERYDRLLDIMGGLIEMEKKRFLSVKELAEYLGIKHPTIYSWVSMKRIPYVKMGGRVMFDLRDIEKWIQERKVEVHKIWR